MHSNPNLNHRSAYPRWLLIGIRALLAKLLTLYFAWHSPKCTATYKLALIAALAYLLFPYDLIHDLATSFGYADDGTFMGAAIMTFSSCIDARVKSLAKRKAQAMVYVPKGKR
ncbi:hypothetical protein W04_0317 [Pseudoalteromonas sp. SW0106-04]|uniref:DUF1232 domain-containing protein n=1 Tax=Pseudoalteromonas TaxID=53246 RepID=UPI0006B581A5|nr:MULTISPECIES: DUF1232 domain-containing protein [Pseudoalteromonas]GAP73806.1 hypothetical protein W04_0317 [Pseudoalteromonas sp. SW0106-04]|tara:strand:- start:15297 stop:15635 length:339 start_codon:yes stop_codon:yes gene_type:complete